SPRWRCAWVGSAGEDGKPSVERGAAVRLERDHAAAGHASTPAVVAPRAAGDAPAIARTDGGAVGILALVQRHAGAKGAARQVEAGALLERERARIEAALRAAQNAPSDELSDDDDELGDLGTDTFQAELDEGRRDELADQLRALERAEQRLADGTYGRSVLSG